MMLTRRQRYRDLVNTGAVFSLMLNKGLMERPISDCCRICLSIFHLYLDTWCEIWTISKKMCNRIDAFELWTNVKKFLKITNQKVLRRVQLKKACLLADIRKKKMGYFGHIIRHRTLEHVLLEGKIEGWGRPRAMWMGNITEWSGFDYVEAATKKAQNRNYWRQLIASDAAMDGT